MGTGEASLEEGLRRQPRCLNFVLGKKSRVLRRSVIGSDLHFLKIIGGAWIIGERESYLSPLRSHAAGDGDSEVMNSPVWELVVQSLDTRVHLHITA